MFFGKKKKKQNLGQPQGIVERVQTLLRANIHAALDQAEDPEKMLDQYVRDFTENIQGAELAVAETIGHLRLMERDSLDAEKDASDWGQKAAAASARADRMLAEGKTGEANKFNGLAATAIQRQISAEERVRSYAPQIETQTHTNEQLKQGLNVMREKLNELTNKRSELLARNSVAEAQTRVVSAVTALNGSDPTSDISRFEMTVRKKEALAQGRAEVAASTLDSQFNELESLGELSEVQERLAALKSGGTSARPQTSITGG